MSVGSIDFCPDWFGVYKRLRILPINNRNKFMAKVITDQINILITRLETKYSISVRWLVVDGGYIETNICTSTNL